LYLGGFGTRFSIENTLTQAAPLLLTALCTLIPARVGLLVIGGEGAVVLGGLGAVLAGVALASAPASVGTILTGSPGALPGRILDRRCRRVEAHARRERDHFHAAHELHRDRSDESPHQRPDP